MDSGKIDVLFVCVHNAGRSQMAEAYFNHFSAHQGLNLVAASAGTLGGGELNPVAVEAMEADGVSMSGQSPKALTQEMADHAKKIVSMGCGVDAAACPAKFLVTEDWGLDDPAGQSMDVIKAIRDQVRFRVLQLLEDLA